MRDERDPGTLDLITGGLHLGYARVSTEAVAADAFLTHVPKLG